MASEPFALSLEMGAWIGGVLGAVAGFLAARLSGSTLTKPRALWIETAVAVAIGAALALVAYFGLFLMETVAAFFNRPASAAMPLLFTTVMLAAWVVALWIKGRRRAR